MISHVESARADKAYGTARDKVLRQVGCKMICGITKLDGLCEEQTNNLTQLLGRDLVLVFTKAFLAVVSFRLVGVPEFLEVLRMAAGFERLDVYLTIRVQVQREVISPDRDSRSVRTVSRSHGEFVEVRHIRDAFSQNICVRQRPIAKHFTLKRCYRRVRVHNWYILVAAIRISGYAREESGETNENGVAD